MSVPDDNCSVRARRRYGHSEHGEEGSRPEHGRRPSALHRNPADRSEVHRGGEEVRHRHPRGLRHRPDAAARGVRRDRRPVRLRQEHAAAAGRRAQQAHRGHGRGRHRPPRVRLPGPDPAPLAFGRAQHRAARGAARAAQARAAATGGGRDRPGGPAGVRASPAPDALRRHADAGLAGPGPAARPGPAAVRRAVRRAGRADPGAAQRRAAPALHGPAVHRAVRHPLGRGGGLPLLPGGPHVAPSGPHRRGLPGALRLPPRRRAPLHPRVHRPDRTGLGPAAGRIRRCAATAERFPPRTGEPCEHADPGGSC